MMLKYQGPHDSFFEIVINFDLDHKDNGKPLYYFKQRIGMMRSTF